MRSITQRELVREITRLKDQVLDWDIVVDDARRDRDQDTDRLDIAMRERDRCATHLAGLIALHHEPYAADEAST